MRVLVLGGAGAMAEIIELDLLKSGAEVIVADRDPKRVKKRVKSLKSRKATGKVMDIKAKDFVDQLKKTNADVLINSTWYELNMIVMSAAIKAGLHYVDLGGLYWKTLEQRKLQKQAKDAGVICVLGMGSTPGIMNVLAARGAQHFDTIRKMELRCADAVLEEIPESEYFVSPYAIKTVIDEVLMKPPVFRNGRIVMEKPLGKPVPMTFDKPIGKVTGYFTIHSELATMPQVFKKKGLKELDFAYAYDPELIKIITALSRIGMTSKEKIKFNNCEISPYDFIAEVDKRIPRSEKDPKDVEVLRVDLWGTYKGKKRFVRVSDVAHYLWEKSAGSIETGVPASIVAQWIAKKKISKPGVWAPEEIVDPLSFFKELKKRNIDVYEQINNGPKKKIN